MPESTGILMSGFFASNLVQSSLGHSNDKNLVGKNVSIKPM